MMAVAAPSTPAEAGERRGPFGLPATVGGFDLAVAGLIFFVPFLVAPGLDEARWAAKLALLLVAGAGGMVALVALAFAGSKAARLGCAYLAWALLAALASSSPRLALLGGYGIDRGWLVLCAVLGLWALGRLVHPDARALLEGAAVASIVLSTALAVAQVALGESLGALASPDGRPAAFTDSSVYYGALAAGGLLLVARRLGTTDSARHLALATGLVAFLAMGANLSGSRVALAVGLVGTMVAVCRRGWRRIALAAAALAVGVLVSVAIPSSSAVGRAEADASGGLAPRLAMWRAGGEAVTERPLVGWGPGQFRAATSSRVTPAFVRAEGQDRLFFDAHDIFVEQATTTGLVGLVLFCGFAWTASRRARGPLAWLAAGVAVTWLLEPMSISTAPVVAIAVGASWGVRPTLPRPRAVALAASVACGLGAVAALCLVVGSWHVHRGIARSSAAELRAADRILPDDAQLADLDSTLWLVEADNLPVGPIDDPVRLRLLRRAEAASEKATRLDPGRPIFWTNLGYIRLRMGDGDGAERAFGQALDRNPWSESALVGLRLRQALDDRPDDADETNGRLCRIGSAKCVRG